MGAGLASIFVLLFYIAIPAIVLYFIIKLAVKHAIKELKNDDYL